MTVMWGDVGRGSAARAGRMMDWRLLRARRMLNAWGACMAGMRTCDMGLMGRARGLGGLVGSVEQVGGGARGGRAAAVQ